ncbi:MAG: hypothetical protein JSW27_22410 [Phycisphaerales bacterium]|nr:MAG: hypothetical protein JSW27_22410 [Phycisphaerales bacterium]
MNQRVLLLSVLSVAVVIGLADLARARTEPGAGDSPVPGDAKPGPLYMLTYDHGGLVLWGRDHFAEHLRSAIGWLDRYPSFKIGLDNEAYTYDQLAREKPELLAEIRRYLNDYDGRFGIGTCTYGQPLSAFIDEESNIRQIGLALEADRKHLGCAPTVYVMSEHAMHSQIPQILNGFGFTGAIMRTHYMMYGYNPTFEAALGWWIGIDGSRIPTIPTYKGQGAQFGRTTVDNWILTRYPGSNAPQSPADFRQEFAHIQPLLATRADDAGLRREELVKEYEGRPGYQWMLLEEIFPAFPAPEKELRTKPNDFVVRMPWGYCGNEIWNESRRAEVAVRTAETLAALELLAGGADRQNDLEQAWKDLLIAQHHDIQICGLLADARKFLPASIDRSESVREASLRYLASQMKAGQTTQIAVFNPLSWQRREWVTVPVSLPRGFAKALCVHRGEATVASAILSADLYSDGSLREVKLALYADLPALSVVAYGLAPQQQQQAATGPDRVTVDTENLTIRTPQYAVHFDPNGGIRSIKDAGTGWALLRRRGERGLFAGKINGRDVESKGLWALDHAPGGAHWAVARQSGLIGGIPYTLQMQFRADTRRIDCRVRFHFESQRIGRLSDNVRDPVSGFIHEDKLRFRLFPAVGDEATGVRDLPFAVAKTLHRYVNGLYWTALADDAGGLAYFNRGAMGAVREEDGAFSMPLAYAAYYVWGTRMLDGDFTYDFALYPFAGPWQKGDLQRLALAYNYQPASLQTPAGDGRLAEVFTPLAIDAPGALLSALYSDAGKVYLRLYEHQGRKSQMSLQYAPGQASFVETDLVGNTLRPFSSPATLKPWQIRTIKLETVN